MDTRQPEQVLSASPRHGANLHRGVPFPCTPSDSITGAGAGSQVEFDGPLHPAASREHVFDGFTHRAIAA
jgi:hypothetical protein